jgi:hypothetical protein
VVAGPRFEPANHSRWAPKSEGGFKVAFYSPALFRSIAAEGESATLGRHRALRRSFVPFDIYARFLLVSSVWGLNCGIQ